MAQDEKLGGQSALTEAISTGIGGTRGVLDSSLPTAIFLLAFIVTSSNLAIALWAAVIAGVIVMIIRKVRGEPLRQVLTGFIGVAISALLAARTGRAEDFFLPGLLINIAHGLGFLVSILVRRPLVGFAAAAITGQDVRSWYRDRPFVRAANLASWIWAAMFLVRVAVQLPLFLIGAVGLLGAAKLALGWPLFLLAGYLSWRIMKLAVEARKQVVANSTLGSAAPEDGEQSSGAAGEHSGNSDDSGDSQLRD